MFIVVMKPVVLLLLLISTILIFLPRDIVKIKVNIEKENKIVKIIRTLGYFLLIVTLLILYFLNI